MQNLAVFLGANINQNPQFLSACAELGIVLAAQKITLIYGGADVGLMATLANATLNAGGKVIGVFSQCIQANIAQKENPHSQLSQLITVSSPHERLELMQNLADGFIVFPGGIGTMEEFFNTWNKIRLGFLNKPLGVLNLDEYFTRLWDFFKENMQREELLTQEWLNIPILETDIKKLVKKINGT